MTRRERIYNKYGGICAYSGTRLESDWQIEHINPVIRDLRTGKITIKINDSEENIVPIQRLINNYKHSMSLEQFRKFLFHMHERLQKLPRNPVTEKSKKRKKYLLQISGYFRITNDCPFSGKFYFETLN
jgi:hypothetical protein